MSDLYQGVCRLYSELFPRNVERLCDELRSAWRLQDQELDRDPPRSRIGSVQRLRGRVRTLKTDHAIKQWLLEAAPLPQLLLAQYAIRCLQVRLCDAPEGDPVHDRAKLKIRMVWTGYGSSRSHDVLLAGLDEIENKLGPCL